MKLELNWVFLPGLWALVMRSGPRATGEVRLVKEAPACRLGESIHRRREQMFAHLLGPGPFLQTFSVLKDSAAMYVGFQ